MVLDQLVFCPVFLTVFFAYSGSIQGHTGQQIQRNLQQVPFLSLMLSIYVLPLKKYVKSLLAGYTIWPLFQIVNFLVIPVNYKVVAVNGFSLLWNSLLFGYVQQQHGESGCTTTSKGSPLN